MAESEPSRPGVLAVRLSVEPSHVTRQVRQLEDAGYMRRFPHPDDRRAQRVRITDTGLAAFERVREAGRRGVGTALSEWSTEGGDFSPASSAGRRLRRTRGDGVGPSPRRPVAPHSAD
ncbi:MarR family transcriptional regulator [Streptomyces sp. NPDC057438]|uniref:MarR family transcriptional regulator n=1 Tax=Streptomyces sp. NPDC057438 TaxID=3346133 RepID=UPI0036B96518